MFCRDKHLFSHREVYFCRDKSFVATKKIIKKIATKLLSRQTTKHVFCRDEHVFVATKMILVAAPVNDSGGDMGRTGD